MAAVIDAATFEQLSGDMGADFIGELIDTYCEETPRLISDLQQALAQGNAELFRRSAHSIKSSSATFGALDFAALARELEMIGKAGTLAGSESKTAHLVNEYGDVARALQELKHAA